MSMSVHMIAHLECISSNYGAINDYTSVYIVCMIQGDKNVVGRSDYFSILA